MLCPQGPGLFNKARKAQDGRLCGFYKQPRSVKKTRPIKKQTA